MAELNDQLDAAFRPPTAATRRQRLWAWFKRVGGWSLLQAAGLAGATLGAQISRAEKFDAPFLKDDVQWNTFTVALSVSVGIIGLVGNAIRKNTNEQLTSRLADAEVAVRGLLDEAQKSEAEARTEQSEIGERLTQAQGHVKVLAEHLLAGAGRTCARAAGAHRVTLFRSAKASGHVALSRWSDNPGWDALTTRTIPVTQGLLGRAWEHGEAQVAQLPDPETDLEGYVVRQVELGLRRPVVTDQVMRPRSYALVRLVENNKVVGVLAFESTHPTAASLPKLKTYVQGNQEALVLLVSVLGAIMDVGTDGVPTGNG